MVQKKILTSVIRLVNYQIVLGVIAQLGWLSKKFPEESFCLQHLDYLGKQGKSQRPQRA